LVKFK